MGLFLVFCSLFNFLCFWCKIGGFFFIGVVCCKGGWGRCILFLVLFVVFDIFLEFGFFWIEGYWKMKGKCCMGVEWGFLLGEIVYGDILVGDCVGRGVEIVWLYGSFFFCFEVIRDILLIEINFFWCFEVVCILYLLICLFEEGVIIICCVFLRWFVLLVRDWKGFFVFFFEMVFWEDCNGKIFFLIKNYLFFFGGIFCLFLFFIVVIMVKFYKW